MAYWYCFVCLLQVRRELDSNCRVLEVEYRGVQKCIPNSFELNDVVDNVLLNVFDRHSVLRLHLTAPQNQHHRVPINLAALPDQPLQLHVPLTEVCLHRPIPKTSYCPFRQHQLF